MTIDKCRTCKHAFATGKDRVYCKKSLADKDDCGEYKAKGKPLKKYKVEILTHGNCMICGKELDEGLFFCKECKLKAESEG